MKDLTEDDLYERQYLAIKELLVAVRSYLEYEPQLKSDPKFQLVSAAEVDAATTERLILEHDPGTYWRRKAIRSLGRYLVAAGGIKSMDIAFAEVLNTLGPTAGSAVDLCWDMIRDPASEKAGDIWVA